MNNLLDRFIGQLNTLVPFLALSHEEFFKMIQQKEAAWFPKGEADQVPETFRLYTTQIAHGAFLLGYSYFEAFLGDLVKEIYQKRPGMLPEDKQIRYCDILECDQSYEKIISLMIDKEVFSLFYNSLEEVFKYFEKKLNLSFQDPDDRNRIIEASLIRNCLIHNMARVDTRLARLSKWNEGENIELQPSDAHEFGIIVRRLVRKLYKQVEDNFGDYLQFDTQNNCRSRADGINNIIMLLIIMLFIIVQVFIPVGDNPSCSGLDIITPVLPTKSSSIFSAKNILIANPAAAIGRFIANRNISYIGFTNISSRWLSFPFIASQHKPFGNRNFVNFGNNRFIQANHDSDYFYNGWRFSIIPYQHISTKFHISFIPSPCPLNMFWSFMFNGHKNIRLFCCEQGFGAFLGSISGYFGYLNRPFQFFAMFFHSDKLSMGHFPEVFCGEPQKEGKSSEKEIKQDEQPVSRFTREDIVPLIILIFAIASFIVFWIGDIFYKKGFERLAQIIVFIGIIGGTIAVLVVIMVCGGML
jgi:hypothetical protein